MNAAEDLGIVHFLAYSDLLARGILVVLLTMSIVSWYLILSRALMHAIDCRRGTRFMRALPRLRSLPAVDAHVAGHPGTNTLTTLAAAALDAGRRYKSLREQLSIHDSTPAELLSRDIDDAVNHASTRLENGLIVLASIGSSAPYVGLLGTVWSVYHALVSIGMSGQGTLDQVAGPVGEALIMTALGLAVAIPAVLGYNALVRANRVVLARVQHVANTLLHAITGGDLADGQEPAAADAAVISPALGAA